MRSKEIVLDQNSEKKSMQLGTQDADRCEWLFIQYGAIILVEQPDLAVGASRIQRGNEGR